MLRSLDDIEHGVAIAPDFWLSQFCCKSQQGMTNGLCRLGCANGIQKPDHVADPLGAVDEWMKKPTHHELRIEVGGVAKATFESGKTRPILLILALGHEVIETLKTERELGMFH